MWRRDPSALLGISARLRSLRICGVEIPRLCWGFRRAAQTPRKRLSSLSVILPRGIHPFPSRTRQLSPAGPIVLHAKVCGRVGRRRHKIKADHGNLVGLFLLGDPSLRSGFRQKGSRSPKCGSLTPSKRQMRSERGLFPFGDRQVAPDRRVVAMRGVVRANDHAGNHVHSHFAGEGA